MKVIAVLAVGLCIAGCASAPVTSNKNNSAPITSIENSAPITRNRYNYTVDLSNESQNQNERIRFLVLHYTAADDAESLRHLTMGVSSAHYLIPSIPRIADGKPVVLQLVPEDKLAWHAGLSFWQGKSNLNDTSIGIEIVNPGFTEEPAGVLWYPYSSGQIDLLARIAKDIISRYQIQPYNVVGHSDIAPDRKSDPGPLFPWRALAAQGIGAWPDEADVERFLGGRQPDQSVPVLALQEALSRYGYDMPRHGILDEETIQVIKAFQMHFSPDAVTGRADARTESLALALVEKYGL